MPQSAIIDAVLVGTLALVTCPPGAVTSTHEPQAAPSQEDLEWKMQEHFDEVAKIRDAVVVGELATIAEQAEVLLEDDDPGNYPPTWRPHVAALRDQAELLAHVTTVPQAAVGAARLAAACGSCHTETEAKPDFGAATPPSDDDSRPAEMQRHQWAVERMWEGIVGPSESAWDQGTSVFGEGPGCAEQFPDDEEGVSKRQLCETINALGRRAQSATSTAQRTEVYGDFLGTCSGCHAQAQ